ncbi:class I SAM-dependent methyltransferase [Chloroflexi bacterium]|nr:class I SAM-dependent methyltransferase [Chloroflexota bacterium]
MIIESQSAIARWHNQVQRHHAQSIAAQQNFDPNQDFWEGMAQNFKDDPFRKGDPVIDRLEQEFAECETLVDIGGGAGRLALPLSLSRAAVTVVDSSKSMLAELKYSCEEAKIENVEPVFGLWEDAVIEIHEGALCSHVTYGIENIEKFLENVNQYASKRVVIIAFMKSPQAHLENLWKEVHDEERVHLPGVPELMDVLWQLDIAPELSIIEHLGPHTYGSEQDAITDLRRRLYVNQGTRKDEILIRVLKGDLKPIDEGMELANSDGRISCLISWNN